MAIDSKKASSPIILQASNLPFKTAVSTSLLTLEAISICIERGCMGSYYWLTSFMSVSLSRRASRFRSLGLLHRLYSHRISNAESINAAPTPSHSHKDTSICHIFSIVRIANGTTNHHTIFLERLVLYCRLAIV